MQIQSIGVQSLQNNKQPNFGKVYPVIHWVSEEGGKHYAPVVTEELSRILQNKLVRRFNKSLINLKPDKINFFKPIQDFLAENDSDYKHYRITRSFYNENGGKIEKEFNPISYIITGNDAFSFEQTYGKPIGKIKKLSPRLMSGKYRSAELQISQEDYFKKGLHFVKEKSKLAKNSDGEEVSLHTKFIVHRNKKGEKSYELIGLKFCPNEGPSNPFVKLGYIKE